ncbi:protein CHUP1, chloroplastic [Lactuca sativa]|uniref:protein CHUP1, chloroplastic n=1 Tax=Lactuca sativa TaxID=4236 RepID=UPI000CD8ADCB|nr:protein CHUP1, chloroplastic [Lactuca sativa]
MHALFFLHDYLRGVNGEISEGFIYYKMGNEKRDLEPVLLKFAVPLALSIGGILYSWIMNKQSKASSSSHDSRTRSDCNNLMNSRSNPQASQIATSSLHFDPLSTDKRGLHDIESFKGYPRGERDTNEQEIKNLRNSVRILKERERNLEIELLEYYGQKEQETAVMELQNRLKLNNMEAKLYALKIESLQADNRRLQAQMIDYTKVVTDLEAARAKIKMLKKKHKSEAEQNKNQILDFQQRVQKMQDNEHIRVVKVDPDFELSQNKVKSLEAEVEDLRKSNHNLLLENSDLERRLDCVQMIATSVLEEGENEKLKEESENLKKQNEDMSQEIERLRAEKCADVEELVYLRWINACLRHELRNYNPGPDKTSAKDLSKSLSPKSEDKAKKMILEYANKEGGGEMNINITDIDSDRWSKSSMMTDSMELDESFINDSLPRKNNNKFFGKLIRLLRGKSRNSSRSSDNRKLRTCTSSVGSSNRSSIDSRRLTRRHSDVCFYKQIDSIDEEDDDDDGGRLCSSSSCSKDKELAKYAEALKDTRASSNLKLHRSSLSLDFI